MQAAATAAGECGDAELWVFHSARLARGSGRKDEARSVMEIFTTMRRAGVTLRSVEDDAYLQDEAFIGMASKMANKYSEDLSSYTRAGKRRGFERGRWPGGPVPDGYIAERSGGSPRLELDPARAPVLSTAFDLAAAGRGDASVARSLNAAGHRTKSGGPWSRRRVQDSITNPHYAGRVVWRRGRPDEDVRDGAHPPLVAPAAFDAIQAARASRDRTSPKDKRGRNRGGRHTTRYALARLAVCDRCGERVYAVTSPYRRKDGTQQRAYVCAAVQTATGTCDQPRIDAELVDRTVCTHLARLATDHEAWLEQLAEGAWERARGLEAGLDRARHQLAEAVRRESILGERFLSALGREEEHRLGELHRRVLRQRDEAAVVVDEAQAALRTAPDPQPASAVAEFFRGLDSAVQGDASGAGLDEVNERLRAVFSEFRLDTLGGGAAVAIVPTLRTNVGAEPDSGDDTYAGLAPVLVDGELRGYEHAPNVAALMFTTGRTAASSASVQERPYAQEYRPIPSGLALPPLVVAA